MKEAISYQLSAISMGDYRLLKVWQKAHQLALSIYRETSDYPPSELYGLTMQTRRAAASIATNLAEGCGRNSDGELVRYCKIALGSANELDYQLLVARDLSLLPTDAYRDLAGQCQEVRKMLAALASRAKPVS